MRPHSRSRIPGSGVRLASLLGVTLSRRMLAEVGLNAELAVTTVRTLVSQSQGSEEGNQYGFIFGGQA